MPRPFNPGLPLHMYDNVWIFFCGYSFFSAVTMAVAFSLPYVLARLACHSSSVGREDIRFPSSLTEPISMGTFFDTSGAASKKERMLMMLPSTHGDHPTRGLPGAPGPIMGGPGGLILAAAAFPAATSLLQSIFCSDSMSFGARPRSFITIRASSACCSLDGILPPPPDCAAARWNNPAAERMPISVVTFDPPPDWP